MASHINGAHRWRRPQFRRSPATSQQRQTNGLLRGSRSRHIARNPVPVPGAVGVQLSSVSVCCSIQCQCTLPSNAIRWGGTNSAGLPRSRPFESSQFRAIARRRCVYPKTACFADPLLPPTLCVCVPYCVCHLCLSLVLSASSSPRPCLCFPCACVLCVFDGEGFVFCVSKTSLLGGCSS